MPPALRPKALPWAVAVGSGIMFFPAHDGLTANLFLASAIMAKERRGRIHKGEAGRQAGHKSGRKAGQSYPDKTSGVRVKMSLEGGMSGYRVQLSVSGLDTIWTQFRGQRVRSRGAKISLHAPLKWVF